MVNSVTENFYFYKRKKSLENLLIFGLLIVSISLPMNEINLLIQGSEIHIMSAKNLFAG